MMKATEIVVSRGPVTEPNFSELLDQLDPAIGEASSVMGAMATELIRRSLRGGVLTIGRELNGYVAQQVEAQIVEQRPLIEKTAAETATEVARGEVDAVRHAAQQQLEGVARDLGGRLDETVRQTSAKIDTVAKATDDVARQTQETTASLAQTLQTEVAAAQTRTLDTARQEIEAFKDRARDATKKIAYRLDRLDLKTGELATLQRTLKQELLDTWQKQRQQLLHQIDELRRDRDSLARRLEVLEQPRGLRRLFAWLFRRKKGSAAAGQPDVLAPEPDEADSKE
jgi:hypothetical protein